MSFPAAPGTATPVRPVTRCARAHAPASPAVPGLRICRACLTRARTSLRTLPALYDACVHAMNTVPRGHVVEKVSGTRATHAVNETAVETRTEIQVVLASWAGLVADERGLTARGGGDVGRLARFLTVHLDWLAAHPGAADLVAELGELVSGALRVIDAGQAGGFELGTCIEPGCGGRLVARAAGRGAGPSQVGCDTGRHAWRPDQWLLLRRGRPTTVSTKIAAMAVGVPEATIRQWARRGRLTRYGSPGRAEYDIEELTSIAEERTA